jgi:ABC-type antimicrobial peptide transport system permease subunit
MREGLLMVLLGLAVGWAIALEVGRFTARLLFHIGATDFVTYAVVAALIVATAAVACFVPSRRALTADPARVFRGG